MSRSQLLSAAMVIAALLATLALSAPRLLVWNRTASVPTGLYLIGSAERLRVGERVVLAPPPPLARRIAARQYLPANVPLIKRIAALPGQRVCRAGTEIRIDGMPVGTAQQRDRAGRLLPVWAGCRRLGAHELFVMNPRAPDSFDGRYFGVLPRSAVIGRAIPLWTDEALGAGSGGRDAPTLTPATKENER